MPRIDDPKSPISQVPKPQAAAAGSTPPPAPTTKEPALTQDAAAIATRERAQPAELAEVVKKAKAAAGVDLPAEPKAAEPSPEPKPKSFFARLWGGLTRAVASAWSGLKGVASNLWNGVSGKASEVGTELYHKGGNAAMGVSFEDFKTRKVVDDPSDVNRYSAADEAQAGKETQANAKAEQEALAKLPAADQTRYRAVLSQVEGEPMARRQMQAMLLSGALTGKKSLVGSETLLGQLNRMLEQPLAEGIDRKALVAQVIGEVENPVRIAQHGQNTCGATTAQILLARKNPAEYARLIAGLASPEGKVKTAGGSTLERHEDWTFGEDGGRSLPSRLFQPAVMQLGELLPGFRYDNSEDQNQLAGKSLFAGQFGIQQARVDSDLTGQDYDNHLFMRWNRDAQWDKLKGVLDKGQEPVPVSMAWDGGGHFVQVDRIEGGQVHYTNPWGQRESMDEAEFKAHITEFQAIDD